MQSIGEGPQISNYKYHPLVGVVDMCGIIQHMVPESQPQHMYYRGLHAPTTTPHQPSMNRSVQFKLIAADWQQLNMSQIRFVV